MPIGRVVSEGLQNGRERVFLIWPSGAESLLNSMPRHITEAGGYVRALTFFAWALASIGGLALAAAMIVELVNPGGGSGLPSAVGLVGSSLLIPAGGFAAAALLAAARRELAQPETVQPKPPKPAEILLAGSTRYRRDVPEPVSEPRSATWVASRVMGLVAGFALFAAGGVVWSWGYSSFGAQDVLHLVAGGALVSLAFPILVLERIYANTDPKSLPEAPQLQWLLRVPLATLLGTGLAGVLLGLGLVWATWITRALSLLILLIAAELVLRVAARLFLPSPSIEDARSVAESALARAFRLAPPSLSAINLAAERQFGIDLSRSWAIGFVARAAAPVGFALLLLAWGLTGVTALGLDERAVYQRFGVPVRVVGPGLHIGLPWPLGVMRRIEFGVLHDTPVAVADAAPVPADDFAAAAEPRRRPPPRR